MRLAVDSDPLEVMPGGMVQQGQTERFKGLPWPWHAVVLGGSRKGKTNYLMQPFLHQVLVRQEGAIFLAPSDQDIETLKRFLGWPGVRERVVEISRANWEGKETPSQVGYNQFDLFGKTEAVIPRRLSAFTNTFTAMQGWSGQANTRAIQLTGAAAELLMYAALQLPQDRQPNIFTIPTLLNNADFRGVLIRHAPGHLRGYWENEFPKVLKDGGAAPVTHLIHVMRRDPALRGLLGASRSTFSLRQAMDERQIVLVCLGDEGLEQKFLANLLLCDLVKAFMSRGTQSTPRFAGFLDELHTYDGSVSGSVADVFEQTAKNGGRMFGATQNFLRLRRDTQLALLTNKSLLLSTTLEIEAAAKVSDGWTRGPHPEVLADLEPYHFIVDAEVRGRGRNQFKMRALAIEKVFPAWLNDAAVPALEQRLRRAGRRPEEVTQDMVTLDGRILSHFQRPTVIQGGKAESADGDGVSWKPEAGN